MAKQITFGVSVPSQAYKDLLDTMANGQYLTRSQLIRKLILEEADRRNIKVNMKQLKLAK